MALREKLKPGDYLIFLGIFIAVLIPAITFVDFYNFKTSSISNTTVSANLSNSTVFFQDEVTIDLPNNVSESYSFDFTKVGQILVISFPIFIAFLGIQIEILLKKLDEDYRFEDTRYLTALFSSVVIGLIYIFTLIRNDQRDYLNFFAPYYWAVFIAYTIQLAILTYHLIIIVGSPVLKLSADEFTLKNLIIFSVFMSSHIIFSLKIDVLDFTN